MISYAKMKKWGGGDAQPEWLLVGFNDAIEACSLTELRMVGGSFTWQRGEIHGKLDRGLATTRWHDSFPHAIVKLLPPLASDHKPLWISIDGRRDRRNRHRKRFRFEEMWLRDNICQKVVQASWKSIEGTGDWGCLLHKMRVCSNDLLQWNRVQFGHVQTHLKQCIKKFERLNHHQDPALAAREERRVLNELEEWLEREEIMWRQRSRDIWIHEGDRNTRFFHRRATKCKDRNRVEKLMKDTGEWTSSFGEVKVVVTEYFAHLFTSIDPMNLALVTDCLKPCVQDGDNSFLLHEFTEAEVTKALFQMHPSKSPGSDGLSPIFFQRFWVSMKDDIVQPCLQYLNQGIPFPDELNLTNIVLIPKCHEPKSNGASKTYKPVQCYLSISCKSIGKQIEVGVARSYLTGAECLSSK
ncbi:hypothetical protein SLE2022_141700 [Rubroshorea leprosula]